MKKKLSIYVHVPFCKSKCNYCDFYSVSGQDNLIAEYFKGLEDEICKTSYFNIDAEKASSIVKSIFFGGGTPGYVPAENIRRVLEILRELFIFDVDCEITLECNPGSFDEEKIKIYKKAGINRISLGLQSTNDMILKSIGRSHKYSDYIAGIYLLRKYGFSNLNTDLMFGLPGQTLGMLMESIKDVVNLGIEHISLYSLSIEPGTLMEKLFIKSPDLFPDEDTERQMYHHGIELLKNYGFTQYEISNFAKNGKVCKHNVYCWKQNEYLGFGSAAHSFYNGIRYSNFSDINKYLYSINSEKNKILRDDNIILSSKEKEKEFFMLGLRLIEGINMKDFSRKFRTSPEVYINILNKLIKRNLIEKEGDTFKMTKYGIDFANQIFVEFI